jgi:hypothetical protein
MHIAMIQMHLFSIPIHELCMFSLTLKEMDLICLYTIILDHYVDEFNASFKPWPAYKTHSFDCGVVMS